MLCSRCPVHYHRGVCPQCGRSQPGREPPVDLSRYAVDGEVTLDGPSWFSRSTVHQLMVNSVPRTIEINADNCSVDYISLTAWEQDLPSDPETDHLAQVISEAGIPMAPCGCGYRGCGACFEQGLSDAHLPLDGRCQDPRHSEDSWHPVNYNPEAYADMWTSLYSTPRGWSCLRCARKNRSAENETPVAALPLSICGICGTRHSFWDNCP